MYESAVGALIVQLVKTVLNWLAEAPEWTLIAGLIFCFFLACRNLVLIETQHK